MSDQVVDTNVLLFFLQGDRRLSRVMTARIEDANYRSMVSMATLWEISIKSRVGKLRFKPAADPELPDRLRQEGFEVLPIAWSTILRASELPWNHRDPFDRLIIAEALRHGVPVLSTDRRFDEYGVK